MPAYRGTGRIAFYARRVLGIGVPDGNWKLATTDVRLGVTAAFFASRGRTHIIDGLWALKRGQRSRWRRPQIALLTATRKLGWIYIVLGAPDRRRVRAVERCAVGTMVVVFVSMRSSRFAWM